MNFTIKSDSPVKQRTACAVVGIFESRRLSAAAQIFDKASKKHLSMILKRGDMNGKIGQSLLLHNVPGTAAERVLLVGCGKEKNLNVSHFRQIVANSINKLKLTSATNALSCLAELNVKTSNKESKDEYWKIRQIVEISQSALYEFNQLKSKNKRPKNKLRKLALTIPDLGDVASSQRAIKDGSAIGKGVSLTRDLANLPPNICTPTYLAEQAKQLGKAQKSVKVTVLNEAAMEKLGMGSLLSVSQGSRQPAKLISMEYQGGEKDDKAFVLVGKGVTFDTGGISIKPSAAMDEMKYDMCGAASVFGTITAISEMGLPINVVGVVPTVENMPGGEATRPGDIYTSMSGQTIEVLNTDAEGRLILCDALTYSEKFNPATVIDIATLTGACVIALGKHASGLLSNHEPLAKDILDAGENTGDRAWQLPLWDEYQNQINSPFADMANIGGREAGTITAACFLSRFTKKFHWAHLDIAGTAWRSGKNKGATGRPVPLLVQYLMDRCE
ncbi:MAG: leucyl aminopeptidase [Gammaproteobacteria bacterium]